MVVELGEATVPVTRDDVELVGVKGVRGEELLEVVEPVVCLSLGGGVDRGYSEVFASYFDV